MTDRHEINGLSLELARKTRALCRLACGRRIWLDNGVAGASVWQLHVADARGRIVDLDGSAAKTVSTRRVGDTLRLEWRGVGEAKSGAGPFDVTVTVAPYGTAPNHTAWRLAVANRSRSWTIWHVVFPRLNGVMPGPRPDTDRFFWPELWGRQGVGWNSMTNHADPCGGYGKHAMQFMGFSRGDRTLYVGAHDPEHWQKKMIFDPGKPTDKPRRASMHFLAHPSGMTEAGNSYEQAYDFVVGEIAGDWFDAAKLYAAFSRQQPWAVEPPAKAFRGRREDREVLVWEQGSINAFPSDRVETVNGKPAADWVAQMKKLRQCLGTRIVVHMYHWHQTPFDTNYPEFFPVKDGFKELVAELKEGGVTVMPYINGRLWDQAARSYGAEAEIAAEKISPQRVNPKNLCAWPEHYGNGQFLTGMCLHTAYWRNTVVNLCRRIVKELGCGGVYLDQLGCFGGRTCLDPRHGHPLGGGAYWLQGMRGLVAAVRKEIGAEPLLTTECNWEGCVADFDALLDTEWNHENNIPLFPAVYWGLGAIFGGGVFETSFKNGGDEFIQRMGMRFVWGGQFGWGHFEWLLERKNAVLLRYFQSLCRLRTEYRRYFCRGEFLRPPEITVAGKPSCNPLKGPVLAAKWRDPDGPGAAIFLVNVTRESVWICLNGSKIHLEPLGTEVIVNHEH